MKKFAIIPAIQTDYHDRYFYDIHMKFKNEAVCEFYNGFKDRGDIIHTIDMYEDLSEPDYFLFLWLDWQWVIRLMRIGELQRAVYCNAEPPSVIRLNKSSGFRILKLIFPVIMTYNRDWVDNSYVFKRNIPYVFHEGIDNVPLSQKKLLTGISADKKSRYKDELYSERKKAYLYFETNFSDQFSFYGTRWSSKGHPCYGGVVEDKSKTFHNFKFALCLENTTNIKDYVTEKMLDCLCAGIVPIYAGATNVLDYIPKECFIDYLSFKSLDQLADYLINMNKEDYYQYLKAAKRWLSSDSVLLFSYKLYLDSIYNAVDNEKEFKLKFHGRLWIWFFFSLTKVKQCIDCIKMKIKEIILLSRSWLL